MREVELAGIALEATTGTPVVVLREESAPNRLLHIFVGPLEAASIAMAASGQIPPRPQTHDLMVTLVEELGGRVDAVEVTELDEGSFLARLNIEGPGGRRFVDSRPSDAIALAVRLGAEAVTADAFGRFAAARAGAP